MLKNSQDFNTVLKDLVFSYWEKIYLKFGNYFFFNQKLIFGKNYSLSEISILGANFYGKFSTIWWNNHFGRWILAYRAIVRINVENPECWRNVFVSMYKKWRYFEKLWWFIFLNISDVRGELGRSFFFYLKNFPFTESWNCVIQIFTRDLRKKPPCAKAWQNPFRIIHHVTLMIPDDLLKELNFICMRLLSISC